MMSRDEIRKAIDQDIRSAFNGGAIAGAFCMLVLAVVAYLLGLV